MRSAESVERTNARCAARSSSNCSVCTAATSADDPGARRSAARTRATQLGHAERLGDVVVRAGVERQHLRSFVVTSGEHDDRHVGPAAKRLEDREAAHAGEPEVEQDDVGTHAGHLGQRCFAGRRFEDLIAAGAEVERQGAPDLAFVVDDQHAAHRRAILLRRVGCRGQHDRDGQPTTGRVVEAQRSPHRGDESVGDRQAESDTVADRCVTESLERLDDAARGLQARCRCRGRRCECGRRRRSAPLRSAPARRAG